MNLNYKYGYLIDNRKKALLVFKEEFKRAVTPGKLATPFLLKSKAKYENQEKHTAYVGIIL